MSVTVETAISELKAHAVADPSHHLKPKGLQEVEAEVERWAAKGLRAHVLVVDPGDPMEDLLRQFDTLGYDAKHDLLLVFDTHGWHSRGWGAEAAEADEGPKHEIFARLLVEALQRLGNEAVGRGVATASGDSGSSFPVLPVVGITGVVGGGLLALAIRRRNQLSREGLAAVTAAKASADRAYADVVLACEDLPGDAHASELQLKASELKRRVDAIAAETDAKPVRGNDPVTVGKIRQLENELAALRSTVLQKEKR